MNIQRCHIIIFFSILCLLPVCSDRIKCHHDNSEEVSTANPISVNGVQAWFLDG